MKRNFLNKLLALALSMSLLMTISPATVFAETSETNLDSLDESENIISVEASLLSDEDVPVIEMTDELAADELELPGEPDIIIDPSTEETMEVPPISGEEKKISARSIALPATAIDISDYNFQLLGRTATSNEDWYYFTALYDEITAVFSQENDGQYAIALYHLNSSGTLDQVAYSAYIATFQKLAYMCTEGDVYYLRVLPITPPATSYSYTFGVYQNDTKGLYEPNELPETAHNFDDTIYDSVGIISNPFDEDWRKLTVTKQRDYKITASYPSDTALALYLYDSDLNALGSFYIDNGTRVTVLDEGVYYIRVVGVSGYYSGSNVYRLKIMDNVQPTWVRTVERQHYEDYEVTDATYVLIEDLPFQPGDRLEFEIDYELTYQDVFESFFDAELTVWLELQEFLEPYDIERPMVHESPYNYIVDLPYEKYNASGTPSFYKPGTATVLFIAIEEMDATITMRLLPRLDKD